MGTCIVLDSSVSKRMKVTGIGVSYIMQRKIVHVNFEKGNLGKSLSL